MCKDNYFFELGQNNGELRVKRWKGEKVKRWLRHLGIWLNSLTP